MDIQLSHIPSQYKDIILTLQREVNLLKNENTILKDQVKLFLHRKFGPSTEKIPSGVRLLFNETEEISKEADPSTSTSNVESSEVKPHKRNKPKRKPLPAELPRVDKIYEIDASELICSEDGTELVKIGEEISEQLDIIPPKIQVIRHIRYKYACKSCEENIVTAKNEAQAIPKSIAAPGLLAHVAVSKYEDALPLYRQEQIFKRIGVDIPRSTLAGWMIKISQVLSPIVDQMKKDILSSNYLQCDETPLQVLKESGKPAKSKSYMWVVVRAGPNKTIVLYHYSPTRSGIVPEKLLNGFKGCLQTDGYEGYNRTLANPEVTGMACLAHIRRKFVDAVNAKKKPSKAGICVKGLESITKLYEIEKHTRELSYDERYQYRLEKAKPLIDEIHSWLICKIDSIPPQSLTGKAMHYFYKQWPRFINYLHDGQIEIDNNRCERMVRPFTIGRKNWMFSATAAGAEASAILYTLIVTAKQNGLNASEYLKMVLTELPKNKSRNINLLLPYKKLH